mmetsp:Transcript_26271/g.30517  ORF Transcript_26271/g.30517 Transcript_26271/m.30517 type:complete len:565 (+) Transcript_26271:225-1919(+)
MDSNEKMNEVMNCMQLTFYEKHPSLDELDSNISDQDHVVSDASLSIPVDDSGLNPLHRSIESLSEASNRTPDSQTGPSPNTPCPLQVIENILQSPIGKQSCVQTTRDGLFTPLHLCCRNLIPDEITKIIAEANPQALMMQDEEGDTPLHSAFRYGGSNEIITIFIELGFNHLDLCAGTYEEEDCFFSICNDEGDSPLHTALSHEASGKSAQLLLDAFPQGILTVNSRFQTPLHVAAEYGRYDIIEVMLRSHASLDSLDSLLNMEDNVGLTPIFILWEQACNIHKNVHESLEPSLEIFECIAAILKTCQSCIDIAYQKILESPHELAYQLLIISICLGSKVVPSGYISYLIKTHPNILRHRDIQGRLPLHLAAMKPEDFNIDIKESSIDTSSFDWLHAYANEHENGNESSLDVLLNSSSSSSMKEIEATNFYAADSNQEHSVLSTQAHRCDEPILSIILDNYSSAAYVGDLSGKLPLHLALEAGMKWKDVEKLLKAYHQAIRYQDPASALYPFMLAATFNSNESNDDSLNTIFKLLQSCPDLIFSSGEDNDDDVLYISPPKRRRL